MGLAASQAKLLSITSRLSDNELRSQSITAAKMALANQTSEASRKYINALNTNEYIYRTYDDGGNKVYTALTASQLSTYAPLKNQYGLINTKGQILVSELDATNYKNSTNVIEFIEKYGFHNEFKEEVYEAINYEKYNGDFIEYRKQYDDWSKQEPKQDDYGTFHSEWVHASTEPDQSDSKYWIEDPNWVPPVVDPDDEENTWSLYEAFMEGANGGCFSCSSNPDSYEYNIVRHYIHTLAHMLVGGATDISGEADIWWTKPGGGKNSTSGDGRIMNEIANALVGQTACGDNTCSDAHKHDLFGTSVEFDCGDENCNPSELVTDKIRNLIKDLETYKQAHGSYNAVGDDSDSEWIALKQRYYHIIEHDLKGVLDKVVIPKDPPEHPKIFDQDTFNTDYEIWDKDLIENVTFIPDEDEYNKAHKDWEDQKPDEPDSADYMEKTTRVTQDMETNEGQWYINLWHRMNGASNYKVTLQDVDNGIHDSNSDGVIDGDNIRSPGNGKTQDGLVLWDTLEDGLMNSQDWLKYALESGSVSLERVNFTNPTEEGTGLKDATWTSIIYTNALDISEQTDEAAIAKAEAEYEQKTREIENKDKQYDSILKLLETEHSALTAEHDSIKNVIKSNTDRTLKIYSA